MIDRKCHIPQRQAGHCACAFAQVQIGGDKRFFIEFFQYQAGGRLAGNMAGKHSFGRSRAQPHSAQRRHAADEAIHKDRYIFQCTA